MNDILDELLELCYTHKFTHILHKHKLYTNYFKNKNNQQLRHGSHYSTQHKQDYISNTFGWRESPEGYQKWSVIHNEWITELTIQDKNNKVK